MSNTISEAATATTFAAPGADWIIVVANCWIVLVILLSSNPRYGRSWLLDKLLDNKVTSAIQQLGPTIIQYAQELVRGLGHGGGETNVRCSPPPDSVKLK